MVYMGSKRRMTKHILPFLLEALGSGGVYVEPFCGGCAMINAVPSRYRRIAADGNKYLIALFKALQSGWLPNDEYTRDDYNQAFKRNGELPDHVTGYIGFVCSFRASFFQGFCPPTPHPKAPAAGGGGQAQQMRNLINNFDVDIEYVHSNYAELDIPKGAVIYCDTPYRGVKGYAGGKFDHDALWTWAFDKALDGHKVFISEYSAPDWATELLSVRLSGSMGNNTLKPTEKLYTIIL